MGPNMAPTPKRAIAMPTNSAVATRLATIVPLKLMMGIMVMPMVMTVMMVIVVVRMMVMVVIMIVVVVVGVAEHEVTIEGSTFVVDHLDVPREHLHLVGEEALLVGGEVRSVGGGARRPIREVLRQGHEEDARASAARCRMPPESWCG